MADYAISGADLSYIERSLSRISNGLEEVSGEIASVDSHVSRVEGELGQLQGDLNRLAGKFNEFVDKQIRANNKADAQSELIKINQELEKNFGHYDIIRRTTTGILQADDLGIVKKSTISGVTEEMMITTPGYWLAPCLVALAAWINDQHDLAERALAEGVKRNDEKASLFFALVCRRADRKDAAIKWARRYLANQNEENLDRKTVIVLDAYASGLLGSDSEGIIAKQMGEWLETLAEKPGFNEQQVAQWSSAINLKRRPFNGDGYDFVKTYSPTWPVLTDIMEGAMLHAKILEYFTAIFEQKVSVADLKAQLDEILDSLVTDFDDEELPLRQKARYNELVVQFDGDVQRASKNMHEEVVEFETHKDFTRLLTDAAMNPETSHSSVSTQKFAIALSRDWISASYNAIVEQNKAKVPQEIQLQLDGFNYTTRDGSNESELIQAYSRDLGAQRESALSTCVLTGFDQFCLYGGGAIGLIGLISMFVPQGMFLGLIGTIAGAGMVIKHFSQKKKIGLKNQEINNNYDARHANGCKIIRGFTENVARFRKEFAERDAVGAKVTEFLNQISPELYVRKLADSGRGKGSK